MKNIVIIANIEWSFLKQRHQYLAEGLSEKGNRVVFVESSAKRNPTVSDIPRIISRIRKAFLKKEPTAKRGMSLVEVVSPLVLPSTNIIFNFINRMLFTPKLVKSIKSRLAVDSEVVIIAYPPTQTTLDLISSLRPGSVIYDCVSNFAAVPGMPKSVGVDESRLIERADVVVVDCDFLLEKHKKSSKNIVQIEPGVDSEKFCTSQRVKKIKKICYFGLVSEKIDCNLLYDLRAAGFEVDIIGEDRVGLDASRLSNIIEPVQHEKLPQVLASYDALILPYVDSEYSKGVIPAKFFECFATGLPVIATDRNNFRRYRKALITGATNADIIRSVKSFTDTEDDRAMRLEIAKNNDWSIKIDNFNRLMG